MSFTIQKATLEGVKPLRKCSVPQCQNNHKGHGFCPAHLDRFKKYGDAFPDRPLQFHNTGKCSVEGCERISDSLGLCAAHYQRQKAGSLDPARPVGDVNGVHNPNWRGGEHVEKDGRVLVYSPNHPYPNWKNYVYRYRLVVEKEIGRYLLPSEIVHHRNEIPSDDRIENLQVMSKSEHTRHHSSICKRAGIWSLLHACCIGCGTAEIGHHAKGYCHKCADKRRVR